MIKNCLRTITYVFLCVLLINSPSYIHSQIPAPHLWEGFVKNASQNILVRDTFLFQSFENNISDTWNYTITGNAGHADVSSLYGIKGQGGSYSMKLPPASGITFDTFKKSSLYSDVRINATFAARELSKGDNLFVETKRGDNKEQWEWCRAGSDKYSFAYRTLAVLPNKLGNPIQIPKTPSYISLSTPETNKGSFFCIDSVYAFGSIPQYSLFKGVGDWEDETLWSHLPAMRHRKAFINGNVSILTNVHCKDIAINKGCIHITEGGSLTVDNLYLYSSDMDLEANNLFSVKAEGEFQVRQRVSIEKTFKEKGKWYFISFPFDVYLNDITPVYELKDDTPNAGGNYFYVRYYDGDRRASLGNSNNNWQVLKADEASYSRPVFSKNKGYLIALDSEATGQTLRFSSKEGMLPSDFGKSTSLPVKAPIRGEHEKDNGWYLCGNPLPAPLSLKAIEKNLLLDNYIYVYEQEKYTPYLIGSNYALPPFAVFFVKAKADTEIVLNISSDDNYILLSSPTSPTHTYSEPTSTIPLHTETEPTPKNMAAYIKEGKLYLDNVPAKGLIQIVDLSGSIVLKKNIEKGSSVIDLLQKTGLYILKIETGGYYAYYKMIQAG